MTRTNVRVEPRNSGDSRRGIFLLVVALMLSMLLASLSQTVLSSALPTVVGELGGVDQMLWVLTAFLLSSTIMMPIYGKLGDKFGRKPLLVIAIVLFMVGSVVGALSGAMDILILGRVVQGLGGGGLMVLSQAIIADVVPARERGVYMAWMSAAFAVSSVAGPLLGGWFTEGIGWRWTFWINVPLGALALLGAFLFMHLPKIPTVRSRIDGGGMALLAAATTCIILVCSWGGKDYAWDSPTILWLGAGAVLASSAFIIVERAVSEPIMPPALFRNRSFVLATIAGLLAGVAMFGVVGYLPSYLQMGYGLSPTAAGLLMIPMMGTLLLTSVLTGMLVKRTGRYKWMPIAGAGVTAVASLFVGTMTLDTPLWVVSSLLGVLGMGLGASLQILVLIVQNAVPQGDVGVATASNNFFRQMGGVAGLAVIGSLFATRLAHLVAGGDAADQIASLTPAGLASLPAALRDEIRLAYSEALVPLFLLVLPLSLIAFAILFFVREIPLGTAVGRDIVTDSVAEGQLLIQTEDD